MMFDMPQELERSYLEATFKNSDELKNFAEIIMEFDDDNRVYGMQIQINDDELKQSGLFDPERKLQKDRSQRDKSLYADFGTGFLTDDVLKTAEAFGE